MPRLLTYAIYPAPYRSAPIKAFGEKYDSDIFYGSSSGDERKKEWFDRRNNFYFLDQEDGKAFLKSCKRNITQYDIVLIYDQNQIDAVKLILQCKRKKIPYIINCDGVMLFRHGNFIKDLLKRYLVSGAAACLASGEHAKQYFLKYGAKEENIYFHPFTALHESDILKAPVLATEKAELRNQLNLPQNAKICIAVGRFIPLKRYDILLRLWADMPEDTYLLLIGGGPEKETYQAVIRENQLKNVILDDFHPFSELLNYYKACDLFIHPTSYDVWGLVVNEAMACSLPVVVTDTCVAGLELIRNGENGYVTHLGDDAGFIAKIQEILSNDSLRERMSQNAVQTIQPFSMENMVASQMKTIEKVLSEHEKSGDRKRG